MIPEYPLFYDKHFHYELTIVAAGSCWKMEAVMLNVKFFLEMVPTTAEKFRQKGFFSEVVQNLTEPTAAALILIMVAVVVSIVNTIQKNHDEQL